MKEPQPQLDPERLAALLDGRLDEHERAALLAQLGDSEDMRELLGDAAAILRDLEAEDVEAEDVEAEDVEDVEVEDVDTQVVGSIAPISGVHDVERFQSLENEPPPVIVPPRHRTRYRWFGTLAAAVVLGAVGLTFYRRQAAPAFDDPQALVALLPSNAAPAPAPGWSVTRGAGDALSLRARGVRVGARLFELQLALRGHDSAAVRIAASQAATMLDDVAGGPMVARPYHDVAAHAGASATDLDRTLHDGFDASVQFLDSNDVRAGAWLAAARVAAVAQTGTFLRQRASRRTLDVIAARTDLDPDQRSAVARILAAATSDAPIDWATVGADLDTLLRTLAS